MKEVALEAKPNLTNSGEVNTKPTDDIEKQKIENAVRGSTVSGNHIIVQLTYVSRR